MTAIVPAGAERGIVQNSIRIDRPPIVVFGYMANLVRETEWNGWLKAVRPLTAGPVQAGNRFEVRFEGVGESIIEYLWFERPAQ